MKKVPESDQNTIKGPACFSPHPEGVVFSVRAQPGSRKSGFQGMVGDSAKIAVAAPPEDGKANEALVEVIADLLGVRKSRIEILQGKTSKQKRFLIRDWNLEQAGVAWQKANGQNT